ncbi:MAG TPA: Fur family transcriptional regulator [Acidothermaceae bacterium]
MPLDVNSTTMTDAGVPDAITMLRGSGLRATAARIAVLSEIASQPHAPADEIASAARQRLGAVSMAAVYGVLNTLAAAGLIRRIEPAGSPARYETRIADNHHHIVCRLCNAVADVDCAVGAAPCLAPSDTHGFVIDEAEVTWWGICGSCNDGATSNDSTSS